tara:strand:- start:139 stop:345 length:207 start_codon:yes stop_codon:yes gene_type:complete
MKKFKIHLVEKHYSTFEVTAEDIKTAKDILMRGVDAWPGPLTDDVLRIDSSQNDDVVTEFYDNEWNEI